MDGEPGPGPEVFLVDAGPGWRSCPQAPPPHALPRGFWGSVRTLCRHHRECLASSLVRPLSLGQGSGALPRASPLARWMIQRTRSRGVHLLACPSWVWGFRPQGASPVFPHLVLAAWHLDVGTGTSPLGLHSPRVCARLGRNWCHATHFLGKRTETHEVDGPVPGPRARGSSSVSCSPPHHSRCLRVPSCDWLKHVLIRGR